MIMGTVCSDCGGDDLAMSSEGRMSTRDYRPHAYYCFTCGHFATTLVDCGKLIQNGRRSWDDENKDEGEDDDC